MNSNLPKKILRVIDLINTKKILDYEFLILEIINEDEKNINFLINLAISCARGNHLAEAKFILKCLSIRINNNIEIFYNLGLVFSLSGQLQDALEAYNLALRIKPNDIPSLVNKSSTYNDLKEYQLALQVANEAIKLNPLISEAWINRGDALCNLCLFTESIESYREAIKLKPVTVEAYLNQNLPLNKIGRHQEALEVSNEAIRLQPNSDIAYSNKAITLNEIGKFTEAIEYFNKAIFFNASCPEHYFGKGVALCKLNQHTSAIQEFNKAISLRSDYADAIYQKGIAFGEMRSYEDALNYFREAIKINISNPNYWYSLGSALRELAELTEALDKFKRALDLDPDFHAARWAKLFTLIPLVSDNNEDIQTSRDNFFKELCNFDEYINAKSLNEMYKNIGQYQPFYLAYQDFNNKNLLAKYGSVCDRIMTFWQNNNQINPTQNLISGKIKVGIVSNFFYDHSVWHAITKGFLVNLDRDNFEIHIFYLGLVFDEETNLAKLHSTSFSNNQPNLLSWVKLINERNIEVLIFPEIGMHQLTTQLANLRLCPMQMVAWGHPETTGLRNIDYYLTGDLYEPHNADDNYTEKLIRLPNLGSCYYQLPVFPVDFKHEKLDFGSDVPILLCPGTPFKYLAKNDWVFIEIAKRLGKCKFVFFHYRKALSRKLELRLREQFLISGLSIDDFIVFLPWLESNCFYSLMLKSDLFLDTLDFSGFNTAIQAIDCALPIVTKDGHFMRGRLASGILKRIGLSELVASDNNEYVEIAVNLIQDKNLLNSVKLKMSEAKFTLYEDTSVVKALELFLIKNLRKHSTDQ